jgi:peptide/nickel transport system permease protein
MVRSSALSVANQEYIEVAKARGAGHVRIILKYIIPNIISVILIQGTMQVASSITMGATLSFAGLGVQAPRPEWGNMLSEGLSYMVYFPHLVIAPGIALVITAVAINSFGDCLRDAFDPRLKGRA